MDADIAQALVNACTAGASYVAANVAKDAIHDAYLHLKSRLIGQSKQLQPTIDALEHETTSAKHAHELTIKLKETPLESDQELARLAQKLLQDLLSKNISTPLAIGVSIEQLQRTQAYFDQVTATGNAVGVSIPLVQDSTLHFGDVSAGVIKKA